MSKAGKAKSPAAYITFGWNDNFDDGPVVLECIEHRFCAEAIRKIREKVSSGVI
jgi:hypothetical protein